eukprot:scaffold89144_cov22-Cyclotella_meneghiniana.AAC.1
MFGRGGIPPKADSGSPSFAGRVAAIFAKEPVLVKWFSEIAEEIRGTLITDMWLVHYHHRYNLMPEFELIKTWKGKKSKRKSKKNKRARRT